MRPSVTNTTTHTPPHTGGKGMCPDTQHILTQKIFFKEERCSRPLYSSHTPHPPPPTTTNSDQQTVSPKQEQPPTHTNNHVRRHHVLPQTPNSAPMTIKRLELQFVYNHSPDQHLTSQVCVHLDISQKTVAAPHTGTQPPKTHNCEPQIKTP